MKAATRSWQLVCLTKFGRPKASKSSLQKGFAGNWLNLLRHPQGSEHSAVLGRREGSCGPI
jgi:hypothetical protein